MWQHMFLAVDLLKGILVHAEAQQAARGKEAASQRTVSVGDEPDQNEEDELLPPEVLDAVIKQSRCGASAACCACPVQSLHHPFKCSETPLL